MTTPLRQRGHETGGVLCGDETLQPRESEQERGCGRALPFRFCTAEAISIIAAHLEALDDFLRLIGTGPLGGAVAYDARIAAWQQAQATRFPTHVTQLDDASSPDS